MNVKESVGDSYNGNLRQSKNEQQENCENGTSCGRWKKRDYNGGKTLILTDNR